MTPSRDTMPFVLSGATAAIPYDTTGAVAQFPSNLLVNPFNVPIEVNELHFLQTSTKGVLGTPRVLDVQLRAGRFDMTNGFCPLYSVAPQIDSGTQATEEVRWPLARPLILAPGAALSGGARVNPGLWSVFGSPGGDTTLRMTALCRRLPQGSPTPKQADIPFVSGAYYYGLLGVTGVPVAPVANDLQLMNTLDKPLNVTQINVASATGPAVLPFFAFPLGTIQIVGPGGMLGTPRRDVVASLDANVAFAQRRSIEISHVLNPKESYRASFPAVYEPAAVAISGYRTEAI